MNSKIEVLKNLEIGERIAEEESDELEKYFVETDQWQQMFSGNIDVVYGPKGSGKSALYTLLNRKQDELFDKDILISLAENVRGATVFRAVVTDPPPSEFSFIYLWKLYCLTLIARSLRDYEISNGEAKSLIGALEQSGLLPATNSLAAVFHAVKDYFKGWMSRDVKAIEHSITIDPESGLPKVSRKLEFSEDSERQNLGEIPIEELFEVANESLRKANLNLWLLFDRLDVAFVDSPSLEKNALRALFRTYNDLKAHSRISLKIFVRDDIWQRITAGGFTEASHITKDVHISWSEEGLLNLIILRLLNSQGLIDFLNVNPEDIKSDYQKQHELFYSLVPQQVDTGKNPDTFNWILSRTTDASGSSVPREVIHLLEVAKDMQIKKLERGAEEPPENRLFDRASFKEALPTVSKVRYEQTLLSEYPDVEKYVKKLEGGKSEQTIESLSSLWNTTEEKTREICRRLVEIGFFESRGAEDDISFWVPFIYRSALNLIQGKVGK